MEAFISYSHHDSGILEQFHQHLTQLRRDGSITAWTDREIGAGARVDAEIQAVLKRVGLFIALVSPAYIASGYCYELEFKQAQEREATGDLTIVPVIVQPCDWLNTPFSKFKALPKDGKPVSEWNNVNAAFLDVIQQLRKLLAGTPTTIQTAGTPVAPASVTSRNYRVKKDFDSIQKLEFLAQTYSEVKEYIRRYLEEIQSLDNVKTMPLMDTEVRYECLLVNRNMIKSEARLTLTTEQEPGGFSVLRGNEPHLSYSIGDYNRALQVKSFTLAWDEFHLYWTEGPMAAFYGRSTKKELSAKDIAETIFNEWLEAVGIM